MTQAELADRLAEESGIRLDPSAITRMERGQRTIRLNEAIWLAMILSIRIHDLTLMPAWSAGYHPRDLEAEMRRLAAELMQLDARIAKAEADSTQAKVQAAEMRERREQLAVTLAQLNALPRTEAES